MRLIIYRKDTVGTCCRSMIAIKFLARTTVGNDSSVVHVIHPSAFPTFGLPVGSHGQEVAWPTIVLVTVRALRIIGIELCGFFQQTEPYNDSTLVINT